MNSERKKLFLHQNLDLCQRKYSRATVVAILLALGMGVSLPFAWAGTNLPTMDSPEPTQDVTTDQVSPLPSASSYYSDDPGPIYTADYTAEPTAPTAVVQEPVMPLTDEEQPSMTDTDITETTLSTTPPEETDLEMMLDEMMNNEEAPGEEFDEFPQEIQEFMGEDGPTNSGTDAPAPEPSTPVIPTSDTSGNATETSAALVALNSASNALLAADLITDEYPQNETSVESSPWFSFPTPEGHQPFTVVVRDPRQETTIRYYGFYTQRWERSVYAPDPSFPSGRRWVATDVEISKAVVFADQNFNEVFRITVGYETRIGSEGRIPRRRPSIGYSVSVTVDGQPVVTTIRQGGMLGITVGTSGGRGLFPGTELPDYADTAAGGAILTASLDTSGGPWTTASFENGLPTEMIGTLANLADQRPAADAASIVPPAESTPANPVIYPLQSENMGTEAIVMPEPSTPVIPPTDTSGGWGGTSESGGDTFSFLNNSAQLPQANQGNAPQPTVEISLAQAMTEIQNLIPGTLLPFGSNIAVTTRVTPVVWRSCCYLSDNPVTIQLDSTNGPEISNVNLELQEMGTRVTWQAINTPGALRAVNQIRDRLPENLRPYLETGTDESVLTIHLILRTSDFNPGFGQDQWVIRGRRGNQADAEIGPIDTTLVYLSNNGNEYNTAADGRVGPVWRIRLTIQRIRVAEAWFNTWEAGRLYTPLYIRRRDDGNFDLVQFWPSSSGGGPQLIRRATFSRSSSTAQASIVGEPSMVASAIGGNGVLPTSLLTSVTADITGGAEPPPPTVGESTAESVAAAQASSIGEETIGATNSAGNYEPPVAPAFQWGPPTASITTSSTASVTTSLGEDEDATGESDHAPTQVPPDTQAASTGMATSPFIPTSLAVGLSTEEAEETAPGDWDSPLLMSWLDLTEFGNFLFNMSELESARLARENPELYEALLQFMHGPDAASLPETGEIPAELTSDLSGN